MTRNYCLIALLFIGNFVSAQNKINFSFNHNGITRNYFVYVPNIYYASNKKVPLVLNLHGYTSNAEQEELYTKFNNVADTANIIIAYPDATPDPITQQKLWNFGIFGFNVDDVGFLNQMIDSISSYFLINQERVYACGISAGATMAYYMACKSDKLAAVGSVAGAMSKNLYQTCVPSFPIPIIDFRGTDDTVGPWNGDINTQGIEDIISFWVNKNQCNPTPTVTQIPNINISDGANAENYLYSEGINGHTVEFYKIYGGGHTWPGASVNIFGMDLPLPIGNTCMDFDATKEIWCFFNQFPKSELTNSVELKAITEFDFSYYPNPAKDILNVTFESNSPKTIFLMDLNGRILLIEDDIMRETKLNISEFSNGVYLLKIENKVKKIVIE